MNKKGFTIIELLTVMFILSLLFLLFITSFGTTTERIREGNRAPAVLNNAANIYFHLNVNNPNPTTPFHFRTETDGSLTSCISIRRLIRSGYLQRNIYQEYINHYVRVSTSSAGNTVQSNSNNCTGMLNQ